MMIKNATQAALCIVASLFLQHNAAQAQGGNCAAHEAVVERLAQKYGETRKSLGLAANNAVVEVFANETTGTWTHTVTTASGMTCLVASGENYQAFADALPKPGVEG